MFESPGRADNFDDGLPEAWNSKIQAEFGRLSEDLSGRFFVLDPDEIGTSPAPFVADVHWFANPSEPEHCLGNLDARRLCDRDSRSRLVLHNEYCEYAIIRREDADGVLRPKRIEVTTELAEYWRVLAISSPESLRSTTESVLGERPSWKDLYGADPHSLNADEREAAFDAHLVGAVEDGTVTEPLSGLNREHALFMRHQINGLDDLLFIVMFGAHPYASTAPGGAPEPASLDDIFTDHGRPDLFCRHADPGAAKGAGDAVWSGHRVAFANPLGMYIQSVGREAFTLEGQAIPDPWVRLSRGQEGMFQRLVLGPPDDENAFLDEIEVDGEPLEGGYQVLERVEVGPNLLVQPTESPTTKDLKVVRRHPAPDCGSRRACKEIHALQEAPGIVTVPRKRPGMHRTLG